MKDTKKIRIQRVSTWSIIVTIVLAVIFAAVSVSSEKEFQVLRQTTDEYILCQNSAKELQDGSDYLTEQVRMYAMTGKTEYYSMRLVAESYGKSEESLPEEIRDVQLSTEDKALSAQDKRTKAQDIVCDTAYQSVRNEITDNVTECMNSLIRLTRNRQGRASTIFSDMYLKLEISIVVLVAMMLVICMLVRKLVVQPLVSYNESIKLGEIFPVIGAAELQNLAETYNKVYQETQKIIRHQAEHDSMTDLLNRGAFEKILNIYENGEPNFALILVDVDTFKSVNDTHGHAMGDKILKKVSKLFKDADKVLYRVKENGRNGCDFY